jgi:hypothetical protein
MIGYGVGQRRGMVLRRGVCDDSIEFDTVEKALAAKAPPVAPDERRTSREKLDCVTYW